MLTGFTTYTLTALIFYFVIGFFGLISHFLKQKIKGQTIHEIREWFGDNFKETLLSLIAYTIGFTILVQTGDLSIMTAFMSGYMSDSLFSRKAKETDELSGKD